MKKHTKITYSKVGDRYETKNPIKKLAQTAAKKTSKNLKKQGFSEISETRGESAFVWKQGDVYMASVIEGLGTKNLVADAMRKITGKSHYEIIGYDTVATIVNDLITVGAQPLVVHAYWVIEDNSWLQDEEKMRDFIKGWKEACDDAGATWGGGETPTLKGIIKKDTIDLGGSAVGIIKSKDHLITDTKLKAGDRIILLRSNGINCNGLSLARAVARKLKNGYATKLPNGKMYGDALLRKTNIYAKLIQNLLDEEVDIHYISNITGHGLRKIMRARGNFTYVLENIVETHTLFPFIQKQAGLNDYEMYATFNMGMDYAIFIPPKDVKKAREIIKRNAFESLDAGFVDNGPRQVIIKPKNITFKSETLDLR